jgi:hypothetical protein
MGKPDPAAADAAIALLAGSFSATGASPAIELRGAYNLSLSGFGTATVALQRSFDGGASWRTLDSFAGDAELVGDEPESGMLYRLDCVAWTAGAIAYRLSR